MPGKGKVESAWSRVEARRREADRSAWIEMRAHPGRGGDSIREERQVEIGQGQGRHTRAWTHGQGSQF